jgi:hypothetical protein
MKTNNLPRMDSCKTKIMKKPTLKLTLTACCAVAAFLLAAPAQAQFTYTGGTLGASQTYDGLGVDGPNGLNDAPSPWTIGGPGNLQDNYIQGGATLWVESGILTLNCNDFKIGNDGNTNNTCLVGGYTNATLNINMIGQWGSGVAWWSGHTGTLIISNNGTFNVLIAGTSEQRYCIGGGQPTAYGTVTLNGGAMNVTLGTTNFTDAECEFTIGGLNGTGTVNLNAGTLTDALPLPCCLGCYYYTVTTTPSFAQSTSVDVMNIVNGSFVMTGMFAGTDTNKATFQVGTNSYVNFIFGGTGSLSLTNWAFTDYQALVKAGGIHVMGGPTAMSDLIYTNVNGQGILQVGSEVIAVAPPSPTNLVYARVPVTLSATAYGLAGATFQWQTDNGSSGATWTNLPGATATNYVLNTSNLVGNFEYQLVGALGGNSVTSGVVALTVLPATPPQISITPSSTFTLYAGEGLTFEGTIIAGNQPIFINWQKSSDGFTYTNIPGETNLMFNIVNATTDDIGYYALFASNAIGTTYVSCYVDVQPGPPTYSWSVLVPFAGLNADQILTNFPANDKIAGAMVAQNGGSPITVTNSMGYPIVFAAAGNWASLSGGNGYGNGANTNQTGNANFNTCLDDIYYDNATHTLTLSGLVVGQQYQVQLFALDDRSGLSPVAASGRLVNWQDPADPYDLSSTYAMSDNVYLLGTFTASSNVMTIQQNVLFNAGNFNCLVLRTVGWNPPPYFTTEPSGGGGYAGAKVTMTGSAAGDATIPSPTITYQWVAGPTNGPYTNLVESAKYQGTATSSLTVSNIVASDGALVYAVVASNGGGSTTSRVANITVVPLPPQNLVGAWLTGAADLADASGYTPGGIHDGYFIGANNITVYVTNGDNSITTNTYFAPLPGTNYWFTSDVPPGKTGMAMHLVNIAISISNSSTLDGAYTNTYDDTINNSFTVMFWAKGAPGAWSWNPWVSKYGENGVGWQFRAGGANDAYGNPVPCWTVRDNSAGSYTLGAGPGWSMDGDQDDMHAAISGAGSSAVYFGVDNNTWHHYAGTYDATLGIRNLYVDATLRAQEINNVKYTLSPASHVLIGGRDNGGNSFGNYFTGNIYGVRIYSYAMSQVQIATAGGVPPKVTGAVGTGAAGKQLVLTWPYGTLLEATSVTGPWVTNNVTSPYTNNMTLPQEYFRGQVP